MVQVVWSARSRQNIRDIEAYIATDNPEAAERMAHRIRAAGESLHRQPFRGRPAGGGSRELLSVRPYRILYAVTEAAVVILEVRHTARLPFD